MILKFVLEHTPEPRRALREMHRVLRPGGVVYISVPHAGYWKARLWPQSYKFFRPDWIGGQHYVYFTFDSLKRILQECGFTAVRHARARFLKKAVANGQRSLLVEGLRSCSAAIARTAHKAAPGLQKELFVVATRT